MAEPQTQEVNSCETCEDCEYKPCDCSYCKNGTCKCAYCKDHKPELPLLISASNLTPKSI